VKNIGKVINWFDENYVEEPAFAMVLLADFSRKTLLDVDFIYGICRFTKENKLSSRHLKVELAYLSIFLNDLCPARSPKSRKVLEYVYCFILEEYNCRRMEVKCIMIHFLYHNRPCPISKVFSTIEEARLLGMKPIDVCKISVELDETLENL